MTIMIDLVSMSKYFDSNVTYDYRFRMSALNKLEKAVSQYENSLIEAMSQDLGRVDVESYAEINIIYAEINFVRKYLKSWMKKKRVPSKLSLFFSRSYIYTVPLGVVLVISPWNYPVRLAILPLISAIAAGNCVVVKPSELTPKTSAVITEMIHNTFSTDYVQVVNGIGADVVPQLIQQNVFNHVLFTGSGKIGRLIAKQCAELLIPYTLELGGKSPCIIDSSANIDIAAKRIVWSKFYNGGQTCIAPDYLLVESSIKERLVERLLHYMRLFYDTYQTKTTRIINTNSMNRLINYLNGANILYGGAYNVEQLFFQPTLIDDVDINDDIMKDEIFGPILPIIEYNSLSNISEIIRDNNYPLALYLYSSNNDTIEDVIQHIRFGGGCVNMCLFHSLNHHLPFGGVMTSGNGAYHGKYGFDCFSHQKSILNTSTAIDIWFKYPPYKKIKKWVLERVS